jgi:hypothetical protein
VSPASSATAGSALAGIVLALGWTACGPAVRRPVGAGEPGRGRNVALDLRCEYRREPLGIAYAGPALGGGRPVPAVDEEFYRDDPDPLFRKAAVAPDRIARARLNIARRV